MSLKCAYIKCLKLASKHCANCKIVSYCSVECQKTDWKTHKTSCKRCSYCYEILTKDAVYCPCGGTRVCPDCYDSCDCVKKPSIPLYESNENCVVCLDTKTNYTALPCNHKVCTDCWKQIESPNGQCCPVCRRFVNTSNQHEDKTIKSEHLLKILDLTKKMIDYCERSSKLVRVHDQFYETANLIHSFISGIIQHSSEVELSMEEELIILENIYEKIIIDQEALYFGLFKTWIAEFNRGTIPTGKRRHLILSVIPQLIGSTREDNIRGSEAIWKIWMLDLSLRV